MPPVAVDRQRWIEGTEKWCKHVLEEVRSEDGKKLYGERCCLCGAVWALGKCDGCLSPRRRLTVRSLAGESFCDLDCQAEATRTRAKAAREEAKKKREYLKKQGIPLKCEHPKLDDILNAYDEVVGYRCQRCHEAVPRSAA